MNSKRLFPDSALVFGSLIALTGTACVVMYVLEAVIKRLGEGDQSLLFWYLPFLFVGLAGIAVGVGIGIWGAIRLREIRQQDTTPDN